MKTEDTYELIAKKLSGEINDEELPYLNEWLNKSIENKELFQKYESVWNRSFEFETDFNPDIPEAIIKYKKRIKNAQRKRIKIRRIYQISASAAAVIIFLAVYFNYSGLTSNNLISVLSDSTNTKQIILPDSSVIYLNRNTEIRYNKSFDKRTVELKGEAFFEVTQNKNSEFKVKTNNTSVVVLGTSFNIKAIIGKTNTRVAVLTGKVKFSSDAANKNVILKPNQQAVYDNTSSKITTTELKDKNFMAWKTGILSFKNTGLKEVLSVLSDTYNLEFTVTDEELYNLQLTCEYDNQEIEDILDEIEIILPVKITVKGKKIEIKYINKSKSSKAP